MLLIILFACQQPSVYNEKGWMIVSNQKNETLNFTQSDLGLVINNVHLLKMEGESLVRIKVRKTEMNEGKMVLTTQKDEPSEWTFSISDTTIDFACNSTNAFI